MSSQGYQEFIIERERLLGRIKELKAENAELRKRLGMDVMPIEKKNDGNAKFVTSRES